MAKILRNIDQIIDTQGNDLTAPVLSFRNKIINGNFDVWQRATSQNSIGFGSADRWSMYHNIADLTLSREEFDIDQTGYRLLFNTNSDAMQTVFHIHLHLIGGEKLKNI